VNVDHIKLRDMPPQPLRERPGKSIKAHLAWKDPIGNALFHQRCAVWRGQMIRAVIICRRDVNFEAARCLPACHGPNHRARPTTGRAYRRNHMQHPKRSVGQRLFQLVTQQSLSNNSDILVWNRSNENCRCNRSRPLQPSRHRRPGSSSRQIIFSANLGMSF